ncbi:MAG TPA: TetR/AcrR family transcriptional regulator [Acidimicrobiales bacterium]
MDEIPVPAPARGRGRPRSEESERAILDATRSLLKERGFAEFTIDEVSRRAGVGKSTIYRRWPTKGTLVFEAFMIEFLAELPPPDTGNLRGDLLAVLRSWIRAVKGTVTGHTLVGLISEVQRDPELAEVWAEKFVAPVRAQHRLLFERAIDRGEIASTIDVEVAMDLLFGPAYHRLLQRHLALDDRFAESVVNTILDGLLSAKDVSSS